MVLPINVELVRGNAVGSVASDLLKGVPGANPVIGLEIQGDTFVVEYLNDSNVKSQMRFTGGLQPGIFTRRLAIKTMPDLPFVAADFTVSSSINRIAAPLGVTQQPVLAFLAARYCARVDRSRLRRC